MSFKGTALDADLAPTASESKLVHYRLVAGEKIRLTDEEVEWIERLNRPWAQHLPPIPR